MASDSEVIKEFLVSLGVKVDESTIGKFGGLLGDIGKKVFLFASTLTGAATAIEAFVVTMASKMEDLYWASQRLGSSVGAIQDYALGIQNLGGTAEGARASLENLAELIRTNPGYRGFISTLGVNPNQGAVGIMEGLRNSFKKMPYFIAAQYAAALGIDERTLWAMMHGQGPVGGARSFSGIYSAAGLNADKAAEGFQKFMVQIRNLEAEFTVLATIMATKLEPVAAVIVDQMEKAALWFAVASKNIDLSAWNGLAAAVGSLTSALGGLAVALGAIGNKSIMSDLNDMMKSLTNWTNALTPAVRMIADMLRGDWGAARQDAFEAAINTKYAYDQDVGPHRTHEQKAGLTPVNGGKPPVGVGGRISGWVGNKAQAVIDFFQRRGWTVDQAAAIASQAFGESGFNPYLYGDSGSAYGMFQLHPDRQANFRRVMGKDIRGSSAEDQMVFADWELHHTEARAGRAIAAARTAAQAAAAATRFWIRPKNTARDTAIRAGWANKAVTMTQHTEIHMSGVGGGATGIAGAIADQQNRVNGDLLRNLKGVVQ